ncbi:unnamed protein product [Cyprideis torosa]|uniref:Protein kinase domain-containing protein n=1 Tax=Cyprideis torosa TaxID=163714 RepID=A0A7R8W366_9CRUS|nr:unnamed protein product [Cyprideis torosa]CAG0880514.1 unnamed protein product [Cyprideis torosa]
MHTGTPPYSVSDDLSQLKLSSSLHLDDVVPDNLVVVPPGEDDRRCGVWPCLRPGFDPAQTRSSFSKLASPRESRHAILTSGFMRDRHVIAFQFSPEIEEEVPVAIKTIKKAKIQTDQDLIRIRREIQIMSSVRHPSIIHIYEVFENREKIILVMEYAAGGELYDYLSERKVLPEEEARRIFRQISAAVYYCHKHQICHRDLKLENILLDDKGNAKIADFGLSNVFDGKRLLNTFCGSPLYASPEIVLGKPYYGPEVDCWSMGVLLYTLVYGAMPFDGSNYKRLVKQITQGEYYEPPAPSEGSELIRYLLTVNPKRRGDIEDICSHPWVNEGYGTSCLEEADFLACQTPVRLDILLTLAPCPKSSDKLVIGDNGEDSSLGLSSEESQSSPLPPSAPAPPASPKAQREKPPQGKQPKAKAEKDQMVPSDKNNNQDMMNEYLNSAEMFARTHSAGSLMEAEAEAASLPPAPGTKRKLHPPAEGEAQVEAGLTPTTPSTSGSSAKSATAAPKEKKPKSSKSSTRDKSRERKRDKSKERPTAAASETEAVPPQRSGSVPDMAETAKSPPTVSPSTPLLVPPETTVTITEVPKSDDENKGKDLTAKAREGTPARKSVKTKSPKKTRDKTPSTEAKEEPKKAEEAPPKTLAPPSASSAASETESTGSSQRSLASEESSGDTKSLSTLTEKRKSLKRVTPKSAQQQPVTAKEESPATTDSTAAEPVSSATSEASETKEKPKKRVIRPLGQRSKTDKVLSTTSDSSSPAPSVSPKRQDSVSGKSPDKDKRTSTTQPKGPASGRRNSRNILEAVKMFDSSPSPAPSDKPSTHMPRKLVIPGKLSDAKSKFESKEHSGSPTPASAGVTSPQSATPGKSPLLFSRAVSDAKRRFEVKSASPAEKPSSIAKRATASSSSPSSSTSPQRRISAPKASTTTRQQSASPEKPAPGAKKQQSASPEGKGPTSPLRRKPSVGRKPSTTKEEKEAAHEAAKEEENKKKPENLKLKIRRPSVKKKTPTAPSPSQDTGPPVAQASPSVEKTNQHQVLIQTGPTTTETATMVVGPPSTPSKTPSPKVSTEVSPPSPESEASTLTPTAVTPRLPSPTPSSTSLPLPTPSPLPPPAAREAASTPATPAKKISKAEIVMRKEEPRRPTPPPAPTPPPPGRMYSQSVEKEVPERHTARPAPGMDSVKVKAANKSAVPEIKTHWLTEMAASAGRCFSQKNVEESPLIRSEVSFQVPSAGDVFRPRGFAQTRSTVFKQRASSVEPSAMENGLAQSATLPRGFKVNRKTSQSESFVEKEDDRSMPQTPSTAGTSRQTSCDSTTSEVSTSSTLSMPRGPAPLKTSPREYIIPIALEGGGLVSPPISQANSARQTPEPPEWARMKGFLSHSNSNADEPLGPNRPRLNNLQRLSSFGKQPRSMLSTPADQSPQPNQFTQPQGYRLRATMRAPSMVDRSDSFSSAGEDDDDDNDDFEILTAESLFDTLLARVCRLTRRLNKDDPFPSRRLSSRLSALHSTPFSQTNPRWKTTTSSSGNGTPTSASSRTPSVGDQSAESPMSSPWATPRKAGSQWKEDDDPWKMMGGSPWSPMSRWDLFPRQSPQPQGIAHHGGSLRHHTSASNTPRDNQHPNGSHSQTNVKSLFDLRSSSSPLLHLRHSSSTPRNGMTNGQPPPAELPAI